MKRMTMIGVCLLALMMWVLGVCPASADTPADATRTFTWNGSELTSEDQTAAFWEYPQLTAGQTRRNGDLTFINRSLGSVTVELTDVQLPYDDEAALAYLGALRLVIRDGDRVLYNGAFSRLNEDGLTEPVTVTGGETRRLSIDLSCDFAYEGEASCGDQVLYWSFATSTAWYQPVLDLWMYWAALLLLILIVVVCLRVRRARRARPNEAEYVATHAPDAAEPTDLPTDLPSDLPPPAPRKPVTIQIDPAKASAPRRHKAAHAAPRHAKKK